MLLLMLACKPATTVPTETGGPTPTPTDVPTPTADTAPPEPTADTGPFPPDCTTPPAVPVTFGAGTGFGQAEDFDFDFDGRHVSVRNTNLVATDLQGNQTLLAANVGFETACTRMLPDGRFVVCQVGAGNLLVVDPATGGRETIATGLAYPNGAEIDEEGFIYVAEQNGGRVQRIDPSGVVPPAVVATGLNAPNGVIYSPDYDILYVGSFGGGQVYAIDRTGPDSWNTPRIFAQHPGPNGGFDGIQVDECGNVYLTEFIAGIVWRLEAVTGTPALVANLPSGWIPNMRWGTGTGGTDPHTLYVSDRDQGRLFGLEMNIGSKPGFSPVP